MHKIQWNAFWQRISIYNVKKGIKYLQANGFHQFIAKITERFHKEDVDYQEWYHNHLPSEADFLMQRDTIWQYEPKISIAVPVYNTPEIFLREMIDSVREQTYSNWELCLADAGGRESDTIPIIEELSGTDPRIKYVSLEKNLGIANNTNEALKLATGEFIGLLDHDDLLAKDALYEVVKSINEHPDIDVIYTDEDKVTFDLKTHFQPNFKSDFNQELLRVNNYICHFFLVRSELVNNIQGFRKNYDGAQDYDFIFRCTEQAREIYHIPKILYHWRVHKDSTSENPGSKMFAYEAGKRVIESHLKRLGLEGLVTDTKDLGFYKIHYPLRVKPFVSIVLNIREDEDTLIPCMNSILSETTYENIELIIVETQNQEEAIQSLAKKKDGQIPIHVVYWEKECNLAVMNNYAASIANGEYLIFINESIQVITPDWIENMLGHCSQEQIGIVGPKLYDRTDRIKHAGIIWGLGNISVPRFYNLKRKYSGYMHKACLQQNISAVSDAVLMIEKKVFQEIGEFDEHISSYLKGVDLCQKISEKNYLTVYTPYAEFYMLGKVNILGEEVDNKELQSEILYMGRRYRERLDSPDPYYNINLSLTKGDYSLKN